MKAMKEKLPAFLYPLFWDVNPARLDCRRYPVYVVEKVLELGDKPAVSWMEKKYTKEQIIDVIRHSRRLSPKTANYYARRYHLSGRKS